MSNKPHPDFQPEIVVLYCRQTLDPEERPSEGARPAQGCTARLVLLPCSGKLEAYQMLKLIEQGADGLELVACPEKACRYLLGSPRAERRVDHARALLEKIGMGAERVGMTRAADQTTADLIALAARRAAQVKDLGPNPMKGGSL